MVKEELIKLGKNMVKEYYNRYINAKDPISVEDIEEVGYHDHKDMLWLMLRPAKRGIHKYEVLYHKKNKQIETRIHIDKEKEAFRKKMMELCGLQYNGD